MAARRVAVRNGMLIVALVAGASPAFAQTTVDTFADLSQVIKPGSVVFVQDETGERTKGKILRLSDTGLELEHGISNRTKTYTADRVTRISKVDSRRNGFWIGALAGAVPGLLFGHSFKTWCVNESGSHCDRAYAYTGALFAIAGGGIGVWIDGMIDGQTLVFVRRGVTGAQLSLRF